jgi:hypothetical protein
MALLNIPGMTEEALKTVDTTAKTVGLRPFPCDAQGWTNHTGTVIKAEVKTFAGAQGENSNLAITVQNDECGAEILINLDPTQVAPGVKDVAKAVQQNQQDLHAAVKILGAHTNGRLDTDKLAKAQGQVIAFISKHKGFREKDGRYYHKVSNIFKGEAPQLLPVTERVQLPPLPGTAAQTAPSPAGDPLGDMWP